MADDYDYAHALRTLKGDGVNPLIRALCDNAADEIEWLRAEVARLASFLHPIGTVANLRCDCNEYRPCLHCTEARRG